MRELGFRNRWSGNDGLCARQALERRQRRPVLFEGQASHYRDVCAFIATRHALQNGARGAGDARFRRSRDAVSPNAGVDCLRFIDDALKPLSNSVLRRHPACALLGIWHLRTRPCTQRTATTSGDSAASVSTSAETKSPWLNAWKSK